MHNRQILEIARHVRIKSMEAIFLFFIHSKTFTNPMNAFPKIPIENSPAAMIIKVLSNFSDIFKPEIANYFLVELIEFDIYIHYLGFTVILSYEENVFIKF